MDGANFAVKQAIVLPVNPGTSTDVHFWETTNLNHGFTTAVFLDRQGAEEWLSRQTSRRLAWARKPRKNARTPPGCEAGKTPYHLRNVGRIVPQ